MMLTPYLKKMVKEEAADGSEMNTLAQLSLVAPPSFASWGSVPAGSSLF